MTTIIILLNWAFVVYIVVEAFIGFYHMDQCDDVLKFAKYFSAVVTSMAGLAAYYILEWHFHEKHPSLLALWLIPDIAVSLQFIKITYSRVAKI